MAPRVHPRVEEPGIVAHFVQCPAAAVVAQVKAIGQKLLHLQDVFQKQDVTLDVGRPAVCRVSQQRVT